MTARRAVPAGLLLVTLDAGRGAALLRGPAAARAARMLCPDGSPPRWSPAGRGWVVPYAVGLDVDAYGAVTRGVIVRTTTAAPP